MKKIYLTHYEEYPIYEPAEGGYYYAGNEATEGYECDSREEALQQLAKMQTELESDGFVVFDDKAIKHSRYIGEGESWRIENHYGSRNSGKQIYC